MRIVLDTNVLMSGIFFRGPPYWILQAWHEERVQLAVCLEILAEYRQAAVRLSQRYKGIDISSLLDLVAVHSDIVQAVLLPRPVCADRNDDIFLACALAAGTRIIVSGDRHLLAVSDWAGIQVLRPKTFVDEFL